ncbi:MAG: DUF4359 domain-containing protein [Flavobacteriales bacterium]|jgi:hypothetical protein
MKRLISLAIVPVILGILYLTNPDKGDFTQFVERGINEHADSIPQEYLDVLEESGLKMGNLASMASMFTKRNDYIFFSVYEMNIPGNQMKFVGIASFFIPLEIPTE